MIQTLVLHAFQFSLIGANDPGREVPENFQLVFGGHNISDITDEQILTFDMIIKVTFV